MASIVLVCGNRADFGPFASGLEEHGNVQIVWATSGSMILSNIKKTTPELIVVGEALDDMSGLDFIKKLVAENPLVNCALASGLSSDDFHEVTEGLGILMQIPPVPAKEDAARLLEHAKKIACFKVDGVHGWP